MHRLFVAIVPPAPIRTALLTLMEGVEGARWQDEDQLHLTLRYIGEVDRHVAEDVAQVLGTIRSGQISLSIRRMGSFERRNSVDTLWAGVEPLGALTALHNKICHALVRCGLPPETRAYTPHITVARLGRSQAGVPAFIMRNADYDGGRFTAFEFALFESTISKTGAVYEQIAAYPLAR